MQATLASIGAQMGFRVWVPRSDKQRVLAETAADWHSAFLDNLPLVSHDATLRTVEQIDVIWLSGECTRILQTSGGHDGTGTIRRAKTRPLRSDAIRVGK
jgi:hypothetical protein